MALTNHLEGIDAAVEEPIEVGKLMQVSYTVANTGDAPITDITVTATKTSNAWSVASLANGATQEFISYYTLTAADITSGSVEFSLSASGTSADATISATKTEAIALPNGNGSEQGA